MEKDEELDIVAMMAEARRGLGWIYDREENSGQGDVMGEIAYNLSGDQVDCWRYRQRRGEI